jgi:putative oxidoreductase
MPTDIVLAKVRAGRCKTPAPYQRELPGDRKVTGLRDVVLLIGRLLLALIFVHEGYMLVTHFGGGAAYMAKQGVTRPLFVMVIALQLGAGLALVVGLLTRLGALGLGLFCLMTAFIFHTNLGDQNELLHFEKDLGIAGGMFTLMIVGAGTLSLDRFVEPWLTRLFRRRA